MSIKLTDVDCEEIYEEEYADILRVEGWYKGDKYRLDVSSHYFPAFCAARIFAAPSFSWPFSAKSNTKEREEIKRQLTRILFREFVDETTIGAIVITDNAMERYNNMHARDIRKYIPGFRKFATFGNPNHGNHEVNMWIKVISPLDSDKRENT